MNQVLMAARDRGVMIINAPSETMNVNAGTQYRKRMEEARPVKPPVPIGRCDRDPDREPPTLPVDRTLDCDDPIQPPPGRRHTRQHPGLDIIGFDGISDSGQEVFNFCEQEGIKNIVLMGVHTNYCVVARSFGIRQMLKLGKNVVLARDLTDALYDPRQPPYVSHARGTEIVIEHIERYLCPSIRSADLMQVVPGSDGPFADQPADRPRGGAAAGAAPPAAEDPAAPPRRLLVGGGGGMVGGGPDYLMLRYVLSLTGKPDPVVYCLSTASGDNIERLVVWYEIMNQLPCRPRHLRLFGLTRNARDFEKQLLSADAIFVPGGNTLNMLSVWKAQGVDVILRKAWEQGIVIAGESAGMVCWFEQAITDSRPEQLTPMECLGWLKGSGCAHYQYPPQPRKPHYHQLLLDGQLKDGLACDDGAAILFEGERVAKVVTLSEQATAYRVRRSGAQVIEEPLKAELLGKAP
jgi:peptidase E